MASSAYAEPKCVIKRDKTTSTYKLFLGFPPSFQEKLLLAARKCRRVTSTDYIISEDISREVDTYVGKLRSNIWGTKFTIFNSDQHPDSGTVVKTDVGPSKQLTSRVQSRSYKVAHIAYEFNAQGSRRIQCTLHTIPASAILEVGGSAPTPMEDAQVPDWSVRSKAAVVDSSSGVEDALLRKDEPLVLKNMPPLWNEKQQVWGRTFVIRTVAATPIQTVRSVKNFQMVASSEDVMEVLVSESDHDKVLLQFIKIGKDMYSMHYRYPLSVFQAFAICLSSFDSKLACAFKRYTLGSGGSTT